MFEAGSLSGLDSLVNNKYKSLERLKAEKAGLLQRKLDEYGLPGEIVEQHDADTYVVKGADGTLQTIRLGGGVDAPDSYFTDSTASQNKLFQQQLAYNQRTGVPVDQVTNDMLGNWKDYTMQAASDAGFGVGSQINYIPSDTKSKAEGDTRLIADIYNKDNQNLSKFLDTPDYNAAYSAPWNAGKRKQDAFSAALGRMNQEKQEFKSGYDEFGNAITVRQADGTYSKGNTHGMLESEVRYATQLDKSNKNNWADSADDFLNNFAGAVASGRELGDSVVYAGISMLNGASTLSLGIDSAVMDHNVAIQRNLDRGYNQELTAEDLALYKEYKTLKPGEDFPRRLMPFADSGALEKLIALDKQVEVNKQVRADVTAESAKFRSEIQSSNLDLHIKQEFDRIYESEGWWAASVNLLTKNPTYPVGKLGESLPQMAALMHPAGIGVMYTNKYTNTLLELEKHLGREPNEQERNIAQLSIGIGLAAERIGAEVLFKKLPGLDKMSTALLKQYPKLSKLLIPLTKLGTVGVVEGGSEVITEASDRFAVVQDINELKGSDLGFAGTIGVAGGMSMKSPQAAAEVFQSNESKLREQKAKIDAQLMTPDYLDSEGNPALTPSQELDQIDAELNNPESELNQLQRNELQQRQRKLRWGEGEGTANPNKLSPEKRSNLEQQSQELDSLINERSQTEKKDIKAANKKIKKLNKRIAKMEAIEEQTDAEKAKIALMHKQVAQLENRIEVNQAILNGDPIPEQIDEAAQLIEDVIAQATTLTKSKEEVDAMTEDEFTVYAQEVIRTVEVLEQSDTMEAAEALKTLEQTKDTTVTRISSMFKDDASTTENQKQEVLYSLDSIGDTNVEQQNAVITNLLNKDDSEVSVDEKAVLKQRQVTLKASAELKTLQEVNKEVTTATGNDLKSFDEHVKNSHTELGMNKLETFAKRMSAKAGALNKALSLAMESNASQYINKKTLKISSKAPANLKESWRIDPVANNPLVNVLQKEAEYGQAALKLAKDTAKLNENRTSSETSTRNAVLKDLVKRADKAKTPKGDVDNLGKQSTPETKPAKPEPKTETKTEETKAKETSNETIKGLLKKEDKQAESKEEIDGYPVTLGKQKLVIRGSKVYSAKTGKEITIARIINRAFGIKAYAEGRAVNVEYKGKKYLVNDKGVIMTKAKTSAGKIVHTKEDSIRAGILAAANQAFINKGSDIRLVKQVEPKVTKPKTPEPEQTKSVEGEGTETTSSEEMKVELSETELKTKAGFRRRFTPHGLFSQGRIVSFEAFSKLSDNVVEAAAKTLNICK